MHARILERIEGICRQRDHEIQASLLALADEIGRVSPSASETVPALRNIAAAFSEICDGEAGRFDRLKLLCTTVPVLEAVLKELAGRYQVHAATFFRSEADDLAARIAEVGRTLRNLSPCRSDGRMIQATE